MQRYNSLTDLQNSNLEDSNYLYIDFRGQSFASGFGACLSKCLNLEDLTLSFVNQKERGLFDLDASLSNCKKLNKLTIILSYNEINGQELFDLCFTFSKLNIKSLVLDLSFLEPQYIQINELANYLGLGLAECKNIQIMQLNLERNLVGDKGLCSIGSGLGQCEQLQSLKLNLSWFSRLGKLYNNNLYIHDEGACGLGNGLAQCRNLRTLKIDLGNNNVGNQGAYNLVINLSQLEHLNHLRLIFTKEYKSLQIQNKIYNKLRKSFRKLVYFKLDFHREDIG
ncbi:cyclic nucleotide-binding domain protein (macronuclear) [Tetrahymena thermophila SB210]|uniref:Cyclic nucleotide-binding domain protein n=1 Tax=Tetrahymena thermophila (strain SB210) TaxID=312017 RepID=I7MH44_TETTS|nr:cyclic nucleotide-binding domain protein [Tetrahymena thermophila SB210]EAR86054.2 cyclic nucleotide-binding domain protein [Tetrahymena thermophila SB210]|eukprot:XP_976649.2 cyclic nucleotide-binding domain protein [Tetrahymena thermophila SB210]